MGGADKKMTQPILFLLSYAFTKVKVYKVDVVSLTIKNTSLFTRLDQYSIYSLRVLQTINAFD